MQEVFVTGKTVEEATQAAYEKAEAMGFAREDVSVEVEEFPVKKLFRSIPAKVRLSLPEPEAPAAPAPAPKPQPAPQAAAKPEPKPQPAPKAEQPAAPAPAAPAKAEQPAPAPAPVNETPAEEADPALAEDVRVKAAMEYLGGVFEAMGVHGTSIQPVRQGEAVILKVDGENVGALIGRRGETMEALSYLASLVANRQEGDYLKLGLDVAGYRGKREQDLEALARRIGARVAKTGRSYAMEPMNPYERRIIHSTIGQMEDLRSESKGEGADRRVVIYCTSDAAKPDRPEQERRGGRGGRGGYGGRSGRDGGREGGRSGRDGGRGGRGGAGPRGPRGPRPSSVPGREFADRPRDSSAAPVAPPRTERINDAADFELYGKIEL